jgi:hypothetical protein
METCYAQILAQLVTLDTIINQSRKDQDLQSTAITSGCFAGQTPESGLFDLSRPGIDAPSGQDNRVSTELTRFQFP